MVYRAADDEDEGDVYTGTRVCRKCGERKPMAEFHWAASRRHRVRKCKTCCHAAQAKRIAERKERGELPTREDRLRREYGLTPEDVARMRAEQDDRCGLCGNEFDRVHYDHCHETGHVRALLCHNCNIGLGHFRDNVELILKAAGYVTLHRERIAALPAPTGRMLTPLERVERRRAAALRQHGSTEGRAALVRRSAEFSGTTNHNARLTVDDVRAIREIHEAGGVSLRQIGERFDITPSHVGYIVKRKAWAHVD
jgi:hypothetical protein